MLTDPNFVKALLDAKMQEVNQLADYFNAKDKASIKSLNLLNKMLIEDTLDARKYEGLMINFTDTKAELLYGNSAGGITLYLRSAEVIALCDTAVSLMLG